MSKDGWTPPPSRGPLVQLSFGDWTPLGPILGYLDPSLGGWTPDRQATSTQGTKAAPWMIKPSLGFEFVGPGDELGYHLVMFNLILYRS